MVSKITPLLPPEFDIDQLGRLIDEVARREAELAAKELTRPTKTWKSRVTFKVRKRRKGGGYDAYTNSEVYLWVSRGTKPHIIRPVRAKALRFQTGYNAKTRPGSLRGRRGGKFGPTVYRQEVKHPGTKAREFEEIVLKGSEKRFRREMNKAINRAIRNSRKTKP